LLPEKTVSKGPYVSRLCAWAPGIGKSGEWAEWAQGKRDISSDVKGPPIDFTDSMFRRRLSQISKMTVQVVHDLLPVGEDTKIFFVSFRGELSRQYQINKMLIEEKALMPAAFSLSVFNAPAALASIALGLKGGYSALYPGNNSFSSALSAASASFVSGTQEELIFIYADEEPPPEYRRYFKACSGTEQTQSPPAIAFALLLTRDGSRSPSVPLSSLNEAEDCPLDFLRLLLRKIHASS
jgi:hypothetical protein